MEKDQKSDGNIRREKEEKLALLLDFQKWFNTEVSLYVVHREIYWNDIKEYLIKDCPACKFKMNASLEDWLECKMCR